MRSKSCWEKKHEHHGTTRGGALPGDAPCLRATCLRAGAAPAGNVSVPPTTGRERRRDCGTERPGAGAATLWLSTDVGTAAAETRYQSKARASLVEARGFTGAATKTPSAAPRASGTFSGGLSQPCLGV